ncbi:tRNA (adenosine(37)-N6)-threonylcarbamoyltransferase complex transferase subunit TsaD, partial [Candidatus Microgenomates bacterium]|nr:tRNA (adenosine(37)-N6)-threonylcarbamoyltransferase complex transferase subunit TsaD [Candidatus Microgenomates bacterium]
MKILAIDTSCDETAAAVTEGRRVISNVIYSQILIHKEWGGVVPSLAKRAHEERIDFVVSEALRKARIKTPDAIAVTQGPGLAIA